MITSSRRLPSRRLSTSPDHPLRSPQPVFPRRRILAQQAYTMRRVAARSPAARYASNNSSAPSIRTPVPQFITPRAISETRNEVPAISSGRNMPL